MSLRHLDLNTNDRHSKLCFRLFLFKRILTWWYHRKVHKNDEKLQKLKEKRTKILNEVMETETYKVAKEILEKYAPEQLIRSSSGVNKILYIHQTLINILMSTTLTCLPA